jgi:hypothetical protein
MWINFKTDIQEWLIIRIRPLHKINKYHIETLLYSYLNKYISWRVLHVKVSSFQLLPNVCWFLLTCCCNWGNFVFATYYFVSVLILPQFYWLWSILTYLNVREKKLKIACLNVLITICERERWKIYFLRRKCIYIHFLYQKASMNINNFIGFILFSDYTQIIILS